MDVITTAPPYLSDAEVDEICAGLEQNAAKVRFLQRLGLRVARKPNGRPLVWRPASGVPAQGQNAPDEGGVVTDLKAWATRRKHGTKA
jgi:hypothetical protein